MAAMHDHANNIRTIGMGEFVGVLNGVEFRTRHNDYRLYRASDGEGCSFSTCNPTLRLRITNSCIFLSCGYQGAVLPSSLTQSGQSGAILHAGSF